MIDITTTAMTSTISPEYAIGEHRGSEVVWRLSWLPTHRLTHEQARAGMELDEILSDPAVVYDERAHLWAADLATRVGIGVDRAVLLLAQRLAERMYREDAARETDEEDERAESILAGWTYRGPSTTGARSRHLWA
ncbi:hypothetical protein ACQP1O_22850 [Nocardia sp. CA-151230]|uniref:hypothetical protein n=1 Tax=Nocardia sp. CA-151230 TaxID=3239982 RepID=UPI003D8AF44F